MRVALVGLGKLGLPVAMCIAKRHDVVGFDVMPRAKEILATRKYPHQEERAQEYLAATTMRVVDTVGEAVAHAEVVICLVQTPHGPLYEGATRLPETRSDFDYTMLKGAVSSIVDAAKAQNKKVVLAVMSTVLPGTMAREIKPLLCDLTPLVYCPAFPAMGTAIPDFEDPEFNLVGVDDPGAADVMRELWQTLNTAPVVEMSVASAEATKVFYNSAISWKLHLANTWMEIADKLNTANNSDVNVDDISRAISMAKKRIVSPMYLKGGMGEGGGCFVEGELIHVEDGIKAIEDIEKGERVLGGDGLYHEVIETYRRPYKGVVHTIKGRGLTRFTVTSEHPLYVARDLRQQRADGRRDQKLGPQLGEIEQVAAGDIRDDGFYIVFPTPVGESDREVWTPPRAKYGPEPSIVNTRTDAYALLAGYYMAEGNIWFDRQKNGKPSRVTFSFNTATDGDYVAECVTCLKEIAPDAAVTVKRTNPRESCTEVRINSSQLARALDHDFGHGYEDKFVPAWILNNDHFSRLCLRSLFRGDGSSHDDGFSFSTVSPHLAHGVSLMLRRHGIPSTQQYHPKRVGSDGVVHRPAYDLGVNNAVFLPKLAEIIGMPIRHKMQDKQYPNVIFERGGNWYHYINSVETSMYEGTVYNLNVADVHNYVSVGGLVANCHPRDAIALSWLCQSLGMKYDVFEFVMRVREDQTEWLAELCAEKARERDLPIVVLGRSYKAGVALVDGSPARLLKSILDEKKVAVHQWDPHSDPPRIFTAPAVFIVATAHVEFFAPEFVASLPTGSVVVDPWGKFPNREGLEVTRVGRS